MPRLKKDYAVTKLNVLNEMRTTNMTMQELRLFSVYLSKINPKDTSTRHVNFSMDEFQAIMELGRMNIAYYKKVAESLLGKVIFVPTERGGFTGFTLFSLFKVDADEHGVWHIQINANDEALPLLFEFKSHYFKYELWNALHLRGKNQLRMYEVLKQYEKIGYRIISLVDLRNWLGMEEHEYPLFKHFKQNVLEPCKKSISENTDVTFTYEPHNHKRGRKVTELIFHIKKNTNHQDPLTLRKFVELNSDNTVDGSPLNLNDIDSDNTADLLDAGIITKKEDKLIFLRDAVKSDFTIEQITILYDIVMRDMPHLAKSDAWLECYHHFMAKYNYMKEKDSKGEIRKPFGYLKSIIGSP
jgi:plasmid replication initiation protein